MLTHTKKKLTIVTEAILEEIIIKDLESLGVKGYTVTDARGKGSRGMRNASWEASSNIKVEVICDESLVANIYTSMKEKYYKNYAMILYVENVEVWREHKF
ncbi:MAG: hypothetical protein N3C60_02545 [Calditerrivibrio sp.]|nr:hypothetical protein [Calditerrivibrio sp.]